MKTTPVPYSNFYSLLSVDPADATARINRNVVFVKVYVHTFSYYVAVFELDPEMILFRNRTYRASRTIPKSSVCTQHRAILFDDELKCVNVNILYVLTVI